MDWVSDQLGHARAVFAELTPSLQLQTCRIGRLPDGLIGYQGASTFDFYHSRHRRTRRKDPLSANDEWHTLHSPPTDEGAALLMQSESCVA
jgi:hypothetical protein